MRRILLSVLVVAAASSAKAECLINSVASGTPQKLINQNGWNFPNYNIVCEKLRRANASIVISGDSSVLVGTSYGWVHLNVADRKTGLGVYDYGNSDTEMNNYASQDKADTLLYTAINTAANTWEGLDEALASLNEKRQKYGISH